MWYVKSTPDEIKPLPWLHPEAVVYLETLLTPKMNIIEHGGGGSTLWLASRVKTVTTYENDPDWAAAIKSHAPDNVFLRTHDRVDEQYDLMLIDGEPVEERSVFLAAARKVVVPGGYVVLDNANRPEYARERAELGAELLHTVDGNETGTRYLVTEFYRMR